MAKKCPIRTVISEGYLNKVNLGEVPMESAADCMGEECMWYWKCKEPVDNKESWTGTCDYTIHIRDSLGYGTTQP